MSRAALVLLLLSAGLGCRGRTDPALIQLLDARRLVGEMRIQFAKASDASGRAVMADTDADSVTFAQEARTAAGVVDADIPRLSQRLSGDDTGLLAAFRERFARYRALDQQILDLAVENTNLKAQRLSFGPVRAAADQLAAALDAAVAALPAGDRCHAGDLAARAKLAVREIQVLQAPHIAESRDAEMTRMEKEMAARQDAARASLASLDGMARGPAKAPLSQARAAMDRFEQTSRQLIALSRANSNVRSLELALRQQPALASACDESLTALQDALAKEGFSGTR
jgi:hypothetical protein